MRQARILNVHDELCKFLVNYLFEKYRVRCFRNTIISYIVYWFGKISLTEHWFYIDHANE